MKKALFIGALLATCAVAGVAAASENPCLGSEQKGVVGLMGQPGDIMMFVGAHGAFDTLFGVWPEGGDGRRLEYIPIVLKADMDFATPFDDIKKLLAMAPIEQTIMLPIETGIIESTENSVITAARDSDPGSNWLTNNGTDAALYVDDVKNHRGLVAPFQRGAENQLKGGIYVETA